MELKQSVTYRNITFEPAPALMRHCGTVFINYCHNICSISLFLPSLLAAAAPLPGSAGGFFESVDESENQEDPVCPV